MSNIFSDKLPPNPTAQDLLAVMRPMIEPILQKYLDLARCGPVFASLIESERDAARAPRQTYRATIVQVILEKEIKRLEEEEQRSKGDAGYLETIAAVYRERALIRDFLWARRIVDLLEGRGHISYELLQRRNETKTAP